MSVFVKIIGSGEGNLFLSRVPCIGEHVLVNGLPRMVARVEHQPQPWPFTLSGAPPLGTFMLEGPPCAAVVTVEDS